MTKVGIKRPKVRTKLLLITVAFLFLLPAAGCQCQGTIPELFHKPAQEAIEQAVTSPGIDLYVEIGGLTSSGLNVSIDARINNPNPITLDIGNLQLVAKGQTGHTYIQDTIPGRSIAPNSSTTFNHSIVIPLDVLSERNMIVTVDTRAGAAGITLPVSATITVITPDIQSLISTPGIALSVNIGQLSSNGLNISIATSIANPNPVSLDIGNLQVSANGESGRAYIQDAIMGGSIAPNSSRTFSHNILIPLEILNERTMVVTVETRAGVADITLPVTATMMVRTPAIESLISAPGMVLALNIGNLSSNGLGTNLQANISNPNPLSLDIGDLQIVVKGQAGNVITTSTMTGRLIAPNSSGTFTGNITIPLQVLNERSIIVTADTRAGVAGIILPVSTTIAVNMPNIQTLITAPQAILDAYHTIVPTLPLPSLKISTVTTITNSNDLGLIIGDLRIDISRSDGSVLKHLIIPGGTINANSSRTFSSSETFGADIVLGLIGSDYLAIKFSGEAGMSGVNEKISIPPQLFRLWLPPLP